MEQTKLQSTCENLIIPETRVKHAPQIRYFFNLHF